MTRKPQSAQSPPKAPPRTPRVTRIYCCDQWATYLIMTTAPYYYHQCSKCLREFK